MTNEQNFKKGDIVRYIGDDDDFFGCDLPLLSGMDYVVYEVDDSDSEVTLETPYYFECVDISDLELVEPYDRRTDFLRRLGALLREFDARIGYFIGDDEKYGWSDYPFLKVGKETIKYPAGEIDEINADNIMEFEKD